MFQLIFFTAALIAAQSDLGSLERKLSELARAHEGKVAVAMKNFSTGQTIFINADEVMPTASLIKIPIMAEVYFREHAGTIKLEKMLTLSKDDMVPGAGILSQHFSPGMSLSLRDAVRLMMAFSDNTATNMVLDQIGIQAVNERLKSMTLAETRINAKVFKGSTTSVDPDRTKRYGLGSTTAKQMLSLLELLHEGKLVSKAASNSMMEHMKKCDDAEKFTRFLPKAVVVAHKTGSVSDARTDAGILYFPGGPVALCVLTSENKDKSFVVDNSGNKLCAEIARSVFEHYRQPNGKPTK